MKKGQMLVEVVLAVAVAAMVLVTLAQLSTRSLKTSNFSKSKSQADVYAQQGIETVRNERNTRGWSDFFTNYSCIPPESLGQYTRKTTCNKVGGTPEKITVTVTVSWTEAGKDFNSTETTVFNQY